MKKIILPFLTLFSLLHSDVSPPINVVFNVDYDTIVRQQMSAQNSSVSTTQTPHFAHAMQKEFIGLWQLMKEYKGTTLLATAACGYLVGLYKLLSLGSAVHNKNNWAHWCDELSFEDFLQVPQATLAQELLTAIQQRYPNTKNPTDFLSPMILFLHDIDAEITQLKQFLSLHEWLDFLYLNYVYPQQKSTIAGAREQIKRAVYVRNLFISWVTEYKLKSLATTE